MQKGLVAFTLIGIAVVTLWLTAKAGLFKTGSAGVTVIKDPNAAALPVSLTTGVSGVLPIANGGTNNSSAYTGGSVVFSNGTSLTQNNSALFFHDDLGALGIGSTTPYGKFSIEADNTDVTGVGSNTPIFIVGDSGSSSPFIYVSGRNGNVGIATDSPAQTLSVGGNVLFQGTTTFDGLNNSTVITGALQLKGPVSDCVETLAPAATMNIDLGTPCKTKIISTLTLDPTITFDNVTDGNWGGEIWIYNDDVTKQPSFSSSSASYQLEIGAIKASTTPMELEEGLNIIGYKVVSTSTIPTLRLDFSGGSLPR